MLATITLQQMVSKTNISTGGTFLLIPVERIMLWTLGIGNDYFQNTIFKIDLFSNCALIVLFQFEINFSMFTFTSSVIWILQFIRPKLSCLTSEAKIMFLIKEPLLVVT